MVVNPKRNHERTLRAQAHEQLSLHPAQGVSSHRNSSLKQKFDNSKTSQYLIELTVYLTYVDPLTTSEQIIRDRIISICV